MEGWKEKKIGEVADFSKGKLTEQCEGVNPNWMPLLNADAINSESKFYANPKGAVVCDENDILMLWDGERSGLVAIGKAGVVGSTFSKITLKNELDSRFCFYYLQNQFAWIQNRRTGTGVPHVSKDLPSILSISFPTLLSEQQKIATILSTIDQTIDQTIQLIAKYKNMKQGLMHDLLNYGIDEYGTIRNPQTHTIVEKNGLVVPEEWEVEEFSKHILLLNGGTPSTSNPDFWNGNIPWLSVDDINTGKRFVYDANKKITEDGLKYSSTRLLLVGDIIISARGTVGVIAQLGKEMTFNQSCYGIRNNSVKIYANDFIYFYLKFYFQSKGVVKTGSTFDTITKNTFDEIYISLPSKTEQQKIVSILDQQDKLIESEQTNLAKLQKLKQGLMADLLTGKVRVKN